MAFVRGATPVSCTIVPTSLSLLGCWFCWEPASLMLFGGGVLRKVETAGVYMQYMLRCDRRKKPSWFRRLTRGRQKLKIVVVDVVAV